MPRPKGFEPYTVMFRIQWQGLYVYSPTFSQMMNATIFAHSQASATAWQNYFLSLRVGSTTPGLRSGSVRTDKFNWLNRADFIAGQLNNVVPTIFCGVSGFSIG
jgi:hypothetical protein